MGTVRVRFPNEPFSETVTTFNIEDFVMSLEAPYEIFGKWKDMYVAVNREDYEKLKAANNVV